MCKSRLSCACLPALDSFSHKDRCDMENVMLTAFKDLIKDPAYGGRYVSLTPGHECNISDDECVPSPLSLSPSRLASSTTLSRLRYEAGPG